MLTRIDYVKIIFIVTISCFQVVQDPLLKAVKAQINRHIINRTLSG